MSPIGWALQPLKRYADFRGRSPRAEFWWFMLFAFIIYMVLLFAVVGSLSGLASAGSEEDPAAMFGAVGGGMIFIILFWLALIIPTIALQVRRMHDQNRSGWWIGGFYLLYLVYMVMIVGLAGGGNPDEVSMGAAAGTGISALAMLAYGIALLVFYCLPGTKGSNRYGEDPYGEDIEQVFA